MLQNVDGVNYLDNAEYHVDGYGTHIYPSPNAIDSIVKQTLREDRAALGPNKPLWVTEWGFLNLKAFPNKKGETLNQGMREFLNAFDAVRREMSKRPVMYYAYSEDPEKWLPQAAALSEFVRRRQMAQSCGLSPRAFGSRKPNCNRGHDLDAAVKLTTHTFAELKAHPEIGPAEAFRVSSGGRRARVAQSGARYGASRKAHKAGQQIAKPAYQLVARYFDSHNNGAALVETD